MTGREHGQDPGRVCMGFEEAMERARAAHTITRVCHQPGEGYRTEYICKCGEFVFKTDWKQHRIDAADRLRVEAPGA